MKLALIAIDIQKGFLSPVWGPRNNPKAEQNMSALFAHARKEGWTVIHVRHLSLEKDSPLRDGQEGVEFMNFVKPISHELIFKKHVNSAFIGTNLEVTLKKLGITDLHIMGIATDHCVSTTSRMAANLGFKVKIPADAVFTFDRVGHHGQTLPAELIHETALASLHGEFAHVYTGLPGKE